MLMQKKEDIGLQYVLVVLFSSMRLKKYDWYLYHAKVVSIAILLCLLQGYCLLSCVHHIIVLYLSTLPWRSI